MDGADGVNGVVGVGKVEDMEKEKLKAIFYYGKIGRQNYKIMEMRV